MFIAVEDGVDAGINLRLADLEEIGHIPLPLGFIVANKIIGLILSQSLARDCGISISVAQLKLYRRGTLAVG